MSILNRREFGLSAAAFAALAAAETQEGQAQQESPAPAHGTLGASRVIRLDELAPVKGSSGALRRDLIAGTLATGEVISVHESEAPSNAAIPAPHRIMHSELIFVQGGVLEFWHESVSERAGAGSMIYVAYGTNHWVRSVGDEPAKYFVVQMAGDTKKA